MTGLDWVLEVLWAGDRKKDLEDNVVKYASLGIPEYFVYDQKLQRILGYRLPVGGNAYRPILAQTGLYHSNVLGVDLAIKYLVLKQKRDGEINPLMYSQGLSTMALCEAYAMTSDPQLKGAAQKSIDYIVAAQSNEGGWRYARKDKGYDTSIGG